MASRTWIYGLIIVLILILVVAGAKYTKSSQKSKFTVADLSRACINRVNFRAAWAEYVTWLHKYSLTDSSQVRHLLAQKINKNATKISAILAQIGGQNAEKIAPLMHAHTKAAIDIINNGPNALAKWSDNISSLANLLSSLNPTYWGKGVIHAMFHDRLALLQKEAVKRKPLTTFDIGLYGQVLDQVVGVADTLSEGLAAAQTSGTIKLIK